jgi:hypothetical protein
MALLTVADLREHVSSGLADDALQRLLDAAEADILAWDGPLTAVTERHASEGTDRVLLARPVSSFTSVKELDATDAVYLTCAADDYRITDHYLLERLQTGTNPRSYWYGTVEAVYTPVDDSDARKLDQIDLVKLALAWEGVQSQRVGEFSSTSGDYDADRIAILSRRTGPKLPIMGGRRR